MTSPSDPVTNDASLQGERVRCIHAERCGGCPLIALPYGEQLALKRGRVVQSVTRYAALELVYTEPVVPADPIVNYRTRAKLIVAPGGKMGLFARGGGHSVVDIPECRVLTAPLARIAALLRERIVAAEATGGLLGPFDAARTGGGLRAVDLREVRDGERAGALVTFVVERTRVADLTLLREVAHDLMRALPEILGVAANFHDGEAPQILGNETVVLAGAAWASDRLGASVHHATFGSFVQAHRGQASLVHTLLVDALGLRQTDGAGRDDGKVEKRKPRVLDLYGGSGAIALGLAAAGASVRLVESFAPAVAQARAAAQEQRLDVTAECTDVATAVRAFADRRERFDAVVVNPPRRGTSAAAREGLARLEPPLVAYVSCDPETLARDLDHLARLGYAATSLRPLDMIPLTDEVETLVILRRSSTPAPPLLFEDSQAFVVDKGPHEPTMPQGEYTSSLLARARRLPDGEHAVPVHKLDVGTSGLVVFVRRPEYVPLWEAVLASATTRKIYVAAVRGVTPSKGAITRDLRDDGKVQPARTRYRRLAVAAGHSVLRVVPEQGRMHQIRRHLAAIGHPVLGDERYGHATTNRYFEEKNGLDRVFLHCVRLEFNHPLTGVHHIVEAPLPGDLRSVLERTSGPGTLRFLDHKNALGTTGTSSLPPAPDEIHHDRGSAIDIRISSPGIRPELTGDDDDRGSSGF